jgi:hypothetical protein
MRLSILQALNISSTLRVKPKILATYEAKYKKTRYANDVDAAGS